MITSKVKYLVCSMALVLGASQLLAQTQPGVTISFDRRECRIVVDSGASAADFKFELADVTIEGRRVVVDGKQIFEGDSLFIGDRIIDFSSMAIRDVVQFKGLYDIELEDASLSSSTRRGRANANAFASFETLNLDSGLFLRGSALTVGGDIQSNAEVNGYVVALFGNVNLGPTATCHRDVISIGGKIKRDSRTRIYGAIQSTDSWKRSDIFRRRRRNYGFQPVAVSGGIEHNRVDGLKVKTSIAFQSEDTMVPRFFAEVGYGTSSERWHYRLGFDHRLFDYNQVRFGAEVSQRTKSSDDWICSEGENTVYSILRREDFRDYYEGQGASAFVEQQINTRHTMRVEFCIEELDSLPAKPRLWTLFGGRDFRSNFSSLSEQERGQYLRQYSKDEAVLGLNYQFQTVKDVEMSCPSGWWLRMNYQHSSHSIASDFSFDRYEAELRRYQRLSDLFNFDVRLFYGAVNGSVAPHRLFYLGGIRTLRGYEIKEFYGTRAGLCNMEFVINHRRTILDLALLFDIGAVGTKERSLGDSRWRGSVGLALIVGEYIRIELNHALSDDSRDIQPIVSIGSTF